LAEPEVDLFMSSEERIMESITGSEEVRNEESDATSTTKSSNEEETDPDKK